MTEAEWLACTEPYSMLEFLRRRVSQRKLRLFPVGCFRSGVPRTPPQMAAALDLIERYADGKATEADVRSTSKGATFSLLTTVCHPDPYDYAVHGGIWFGPARKRPTLAVAILRDLFGNPFRPVALDAACLAWNDGTIPKLAQAIYDERAFDRLAILADALEDAGCTDTDILGHLRSPGPHVRGCWPVDALLGKS
jgi:hypothetical protein